MEPQSNVPTRAPQTPGQVPLSTGNTSVIKLEPVRCVCVVCVLCHKGVCLHMHLCVPTHIYVYMYVCMCMHVYVCVYVPTYVCILVIRVMFPVVCNLFLRRLDLPQTFTN